VGDADRAEAGLPEHCGEAGGSGLRSEREPDILGSRVEDAERGRARVVEAPDHTDVVGDRVAGVRLDRHPSNSLSAHVDTGTVVALWRYPVTSMMGEELNAADITERGVLGDRQFAVVDVATGKVAGAKNPRQWPNFFDYRARYVDQPRVGSELPAVRLTLPDGSAVTNEDSDLAQTLSRALGREVSAAQPGECGRLCRGDRERCDAPRRSRHARLIEVPATVAILVS
jgi:hypothetical protein